MSRDTPFGIEEATIHDVHAAYRADTLNARTLVQSYLDRIAALDRTGPRLNSILAVSPRALDDADALDAHLAETGQFAGLLHGIPVVVKDQIETGGLTTTYGSRTAAANVPRHDARIVTALKDAGAIILAKTTMPDFATSWHSTSSVSGVTRNPYALDRDPGGSSSGTATAVAANLATIGIGEDTGGSIRVPSSFCNLVGLRATPGLISRAGMSPLVVPQDTAGPMTRTVRDTAAVLDVLAESGFSDPQSTATTTARPARRRVSYLGALDPETLAGTRIGVLRQVLGSDSDPDSAAVNRVFAAALERIAGAGTELLDVTIPDLARYIAFTSVYFSRSRADLDTFISSRRGIDADSVASIHAQSRMHPNLDMFIRIATGPATPDDDPHYRERLRARKGFQRSVEGMMAASRLNALCFPDVRIPAPLLSDVLASRWNCAQFPTNTVIASQLRMPAISIPAGFTSGGLPVGLEVMALPYQEAQLLSMAYGIEQVTAARRSPALKPAS